VNPLILTLGLRYDASDTIKERTPSPRASVTYVLNPDQAIRASFGQAFRKPSYLEYGMRIDDLPLTIPISESVVTNYTEKVQAYELGYSGKFKNRFKTGLDLYYNRYRDLIDFDYDQNSYSNWKQNSKVYSVGGELSTEVGINKYLSCLANYAFTQIYYETSDINLGVSQGTQLKYAPQHKANFALNFKWRSLSSRLSAHYYGERQISDFRNLDNPIEQGGSIRGTTQDPLKVPYFLLVNLRIAYSLWQDKLQLGLTMQNLADLFTGGFQYQFPSSFCGEGYCLPTSSTKDFGGERVRGLIYGTLDIKF